MKLVKSTLALAVITNLFACGGGGSSDNENNVKPDSSNQTKPLTDVADGTAKQLKVGVFSDSPVANLYYETPSTSGYTNALGQFEYQSGEQVTFKIGQLDLGTVDAGAEITPFNLTSSIRLSQLLQSLDSDGNPDTAGIVLPKNTIKLISSDLDLSADNFEEQLQNYLTEVNDNLVDSDNVTTKLIVKTTQQVTEHLAKNPVLIKQGGFQKVVEKKLKKKASKLTPNELIQLLSATQKLTDINSELSYLAALTFLESGDVDFLKTQEKINYINQLVTLLVENNDQTALLEVISYLSGFTAEQVVDMNYQALVIFEDAQAINKTVDVDKSLRKIVASLIIQNQASQKVESDRNLVNQSLALVYPELTLTYNIDYRLALKLNVDGLFDAQATATQIASIHVFAEKVVVAGVSNSMLSYALPKIGIKHFNKQQQYLLADELIADQIKFEQLQKKINATNTLAEFARSYVKWPDQSRFPESLVDSSQYDSAQLAALLKGAGFVIKSLKTQGQYIDFKKDIILISKNNMLDTVHTQRSINNQVTAGVKHINMQRNPLFDQYRQAVIRQDGSIVVWHLKGGDLNHQEQSVSEAPRVYIYNQTAPAAKQLFSTEKYNAALREDGTVIYWEVRDLPKTAIQSDIKDAQLLVPSSGDFAVLLKNGSVQLLGDSTRNEFDKIKAELAQVKVTSITATESGFAALRVDGSIIAWGYDVSASDQDKLVSFAPGIDPNRPHDTAHLGAKRIVATGGAFTAIMGDGSLLTWGKASHGADFTGVERVLNNNEVKFVDVVANESAFAALTDGGKVVAWGNISNGGATAVNPEADYPDWLYADRENNIFSDWVYTDYSDGNGGIDFAQVHDTLVYVGAVFPTDSAQLNSGVTAIYANNKAFTAIKAGGKSQTWGADTALPVEIATQLSKDTIKRVFAEDNLFIAELTDGRLVQWGKIYGLLDPEGNPYGTPLPAEQLNGDLKVKDVAISSSMAIALLDDGSIVSWGSRQKNAITPNYGFNNTVTPSILVDDNLYNGTLAMKQITTVVDSGNFFTFLHADHSTSTWGTSWGGGNSLYVQRELGAQNDGVNYAQ